MKDLGPWGYFHVIFSHAKHISFTHHAMTQVVAVMKSVVVTALSTQTFSYVLKKRCFDPVAPATFPGFSGSTMKTVQQKCVKPHFWVPLEKCSVTCRCSTSMLVYMRVTCCNHSSTLFALNMSLVTRLENSERVGKHEIIRKCLNFDHAFQLGPSHP